MQYAWSTLAITIAVAGFAIGQDQASGTVYLDANGDQVRQASESGIEGVAVTNGVQVVRTDADGRYSLPVTDDTIISVIKPAGHQVPLNEHGLPQFHYIHKPQGSPDDGYLFAGVEPTGPLPESIDFPLVRVDEPTAFSVIVFGDPQPYTLEQMDHFRADVIDPQLSPGGIGPERNIHGALFGISLGDLVGDNLDLFQPLNEAQGLLGVPWYNVYGNHDMNFLAGDLSLTAHDPDRYADETYERVYGPPSFAFQYGDAHFIVLDNVIYQGFDGMRDTDLPGWPNYQRPVTSNYRGGLRADQIEFVRNYLAVVPTDDLVVLAFHVPIEGGGVHRIPEQRALFEALSSHPHTFSMSGHTHIQRHWFFGPEHGYTAEPVNQHNREFPARFDRPVHHHLNAVTASGSWFRGAPDEYNRPHTQMADGAPNGYTLLHVDGNRYTTDIRAARRRADHLMSTHLADDLTLTVNVFNGAEGDTVRMRLLADSGTPDAGTGAWTTMEHTIKIDPHVSTVFDREQAIPAEIRGYRTVARPKDSHHVWTAELSAGLSSGTHVVEIEHLDLYGTPHREHITFRID
ncbi:MAG: calcineurin-like phosphoesterase family protein [Planctomycetota bacterium]